MKKLIIVILAMVVSVGVIIFSNDSGSTKVASEVELETLRGDIVELQGKSMYYRNKYNQYPIHPESIFDLTNGEEVRSVQILEKFYGEHGKNKKYLERNVKLIDEGELKNKGIVYELASKKSKYFIDTKTGQVLVADLLPELDLDLGEYKVIDNLKVVDSTDKNKVMHPVVGSYKSGTSMYFYGGGEMKLARYNELSKQVINLDSKIEGIDSKNIKTILYVQPTTNKFAFEDKNGEVVIGELRIEE